MSEEEKELINFLKFSLLDYEELDTGVLEYIDEEKKKILNYIKKLQKENKQLKEDLKIDIYARDCLVQQSISKDKIRNKIKQLEKSPFVLYGSTLDILKELLGE